MIAVLRVHTDTADTPRHTHRHTMAMIIKIISLSQGSLSLTSQVLTDCVKQFTPSHRHRHRHGHIVWKCEVDKFHSKSYNTCRMMKTLKVPHSFSHCHNSFFLPLIFCNFFFILCAQKWSRKSHGRCTFCKNSRSQCGVCFALCVLQ